MKIVNIDGIESIIEAFIDIAEQVRMKYEPDASPETRGRFDDFFKNFWPNTQMETDVIFAGNEEGKPIAFAGLLKTADRAKSWGLTYNVYPEYDTAEVANLLFPEMMRIAQEQNAPGLHTGHRREQIELKEVIQKHNFIANANYYVLFLNLKSLDNLPQIAIPTGFSLDMSNKITDPIEFVEVMNEAYKYYEGYEPDTPETFKDWEIMERKLFDFAYYYAYEGKKLVGLCIVEDGLDETLNRHIDSICVKPKYHNKGIGSALMSRALHDLKQKGRNKVDMFIRGKTEAAIGLPLKFGFEINNTFSSISYKNNNN
ncbi:MAG: GNAT family N-acetyltransferase [Promethearchaeota archaeon]